jgi:flavin-dependent dehydrogenase
LQFDVVVIGASTAGLHAAQKLVKAGKKVAIFDQQKEIRPARRTLIVTSELYRALPEFPEDMVLHQTGTMRLSSASITRDIQLNDPDLIVDRAQIIQWLLSEACDAGAEVFLGHRFVSFESNEDRSNGNKSFVPIHFHNRGLCTVFATEAVIGADGINSSVARAAGMVLPSSVPIVQAEVALPPGWDPNVTQVWFDSEETRFFYWLIPESSEKGVAGLVGDDGTQTRKLLADFLNRQNLKPDSYQGAKVAMHHPSFQSWGNIGKLPLYLVGDAAGHVKITTIGGSVTGFQGANAVVRSILNGNSYKTEFRFTKRELDLHWFIRRMLDCLDNRGYDLLVGAVSSGMKDFLACHNRDSMARVTWRLPFIEPQLIRVALQCLRGMAKSYSCTRSLGRFGTTS